MHYRIKAIQQPKGIVTLNFFTPTAKEAEDLAREQGYRVLGVQPVSRWMAGSWRKERFPLMLFSQELATLLRAGLALIDALESLAEKESDPQSAKVLSSIIRLLYEGKSLSQALGQFPWIFPPLYLALLQSSEKTGDSAAALERYVSYRYRLEEVRQKIISASVYPVLLLAVGGLVMLFLLGYVVPRFSLVFDGMEGQLPWLSQVLLASGQWLNEHYTALLLGVLIAVCIIVAGFKQPVSKRMLHRLLASLPIINQRLFIYEMARFYRSLGILLQGGIPLLTAMEMVKGLLSLTAQLRLQQARDRIREGQSLSRVLEEYQLSTPISIRMLRAGEQSGNVGEMMEKTANFYDAETNRWIDWFIKLFEPLLMTFIGLLIGGIVILMYIPIFELASSIQ
ncbi:type II secretion system F family protein [Halopseudomonas pelagia]|uniref:Type II secretion system F family protein n=1 Tax=Halopseudomonas pelagia TaxID=553151 RepID=A0AA91U160_9GAMM|nr:type II secretion system F family protein [Halopseudomonas pelagia]PCC98511.1 type II secretion system protein [Halopseudomonas pelagia]QFY57467.1 type II secretion system F family protein [Halopseudomonas pelagia]